MYFLATFGTSWPFFAAFGTLLTRFLEAFLDIALEFLQENPAGIHLLLFVSTCSAAVRAKHMELAETR